MTAEIMGEEEKKKMNRYRDRRNHRAKI